MRWAWIILLCCCASRTLAGGLGECVDLGAGQSTIVGDFVGGHDMRRPARVIAAGETVEARIRVAPDQALTLEIEELYGRDTDVRGYQVLIDDKPVYFRTYRGCGAGPVHYFIQVPPPGRDAVTLKFINRGNASIAIGHVWAWGDFEKFYDAGGFATPFYLAPTVSRRTQRSEMGDALAKIKKSIGQRENVKPAWTTWIPYAAKSEQKCAEMIDEDLKLAEEFDLPVQICFDSWWGSTPRGPDGKGGKWTDEPYQQVVWNETQKRMQLSIPNRWSSTPWLTMNHPDLNAFKVQRVTAAASHLRSRLRDLLARNKRHLVLAVNLDNEPIYWASGNAGLGDDLLYADFNPHTIADAKKDGITLDPTNGLSREERLWLWKNLLKYNQMISSAVVGALRNDASEADIDPLADNVYTQAMMMSDPRVQYPTLDAAYPLWETAAPKAARVGGEWNGDALPERQGVEHQLPLGRNAAINAECENKAEEHHGVGPAYALGQRYYTPYNYPLDQLNVAAADLDDVARPFPAIRYEPTLFEHDFATDAWKSKVASFDGIATQRIGNTTVTALTPASTAKPGHVTYRIEARSLAGLAVEFSGRANDYRGLDPAIQIRVLAGPTDDATTMREMSILHQSPDMNAVHHVDLSEAARGQEAIFVRIEMLAPTAPPDMLSWCAVRSVRFTTPWPAEFTRDLPRQDESMRLTRKQNQLISWRRDAELAMRTGGEKVDVAKSLYERGSYAEAYRAVNSR